MNSQKITTNESSKAKPQTKDYISQIKKDTVVQKENKTNEVNDMDWERNASDDDEETLQTAKKGVIEQGKVGTDKPKKLKDLFDTQETPKPKTRRTDPTKEYKKVEGKSEGSYKPKFFNSTGVQQKESETPLAQTQTQTQRPVVYKKFEKDETMKKFSNTKDILSKAAEENAKIKPKTKDYLDGESKVTYKEEVAMEKPKFMSKAEDVKEPRFVEIDKSEDLFLKKVAERNLNLTENAYTDPKENKDQHEKKPYTKREFPQKEYKPRIYEKKEEVVEQVDSDGFTIVSTEKKRNNNNNNEERPYKKQYRDKDGKEFKGKKHFDRKNPADKEKTKEEGESKDATTENVGNTEEITEAKPVKAVNVKTVVKISTGNAKSLKDLF